MGRKFKKEGIYVYVYLIHFSVEQKLTQHCEAIMCVLVAQSYATLCGPVDCSLPGSTAHGILQERILEWVASPFSRGFSQLRDQTQVSCIAAEFFII